MLLHEHRAFRAQRLILVRDGGKPARSIHIIHDQTALSEVSWRTTSLRAPLHVWAGISRPGREVRGKDGMHFPTRGRVHPLLSTLFAMGQMMRVDEQLSNDLDIRAPDL